MSDRAGIPQKLAALLELFAATADRADRIQLLIDIADRFRGVPEHIAERPYPKTHRAPACESEAYVFAEPLPDGTLKFHFAVENPQGISARAMAVILDETLSGVPLEQVVRVSGDIVTEVFGDELSMGKNLGLTGMVSLVQNTARRRLAGR